MVWCYMGGGGGASAFLRMHRGGEGVINNNIHICI